MSSNCGNPNRSLTRGVWSLVGLLAIFAACYGTPLAPLLPIACAGALVAALVGVATA